MDLEAYRLPSREPSAHKGTSGDVLIVAGSRDYAGAARLAALGAARAGAGYVRLAVPRSIVERVAVDLPSAIVLGQRETSAGTFSITAATELIERARGADCLLLGPGLGRSEDLRALVLQLLDLVEAPIVLDADGLNLLAEAGLDLLRDHPRRIITPHPGEAARLLGRETAAIQPDREGAARALATASAATVVLKGAGSLVARGDQIHVNATGNSGMATAGMGDVLGGVIAALVASGLDDFAAAVIGATAHGRAGDLALDRLRGDRGLLPEDLARALPEALAGARG